MHLGHLALSGTALLILETTAAVNSVGRISPQYLELSDNRTEQAIATVVDTMKKYSSIALEIHLAHAQA